MSFNLNLKSTDAIKYPDPFVPDPNLNFYYTFGSLQNNLVKNDATGDYDLQINSGAIVNGTFSGTSLDSTIETPSITLNSTWSIGFWVYFNNNTQAQMVFGFFNTENYANGVSVFYRENTTQLNFRDETLTNTNGGNNVVTTIPIQTWTHIVWVNLGTSWLCYKNGVLVTNLIGKVSNSSFVKNFNYIGRGINANPIKMNGQLDGFFVYNGTLSINQINTIYSKGVNPIATDYWYNSIPIQPFTYTVENNQLNYYYDFLAKPTHPYGTNKYKITSSFISYGTSNITTLNNNMLYYIIKGLGTLKSYPYNNYYKNIVFKLDSQKWIDESPEQPSIIDSLKDTGLITVEIRLISNNELSTDTNTWGGTNSNYMINILFEPIE